MRSAIAAVLLAFLVVCAGCASPQEETEDGAQPAGAESPTTADNDAGAEPVNPPNETNGTTSGATANPADENETRDDGAATNETAATGEDVNETSANESGAEAGDTATNETGETDTATTETDATASVNDAALVSSVAGASLLG